MNTVSHFILSAVVQFTPSHPSQQQSAQKQVEMSTIMKRERGVALLDGRWLNQQQQKTRLQVAKYRTGKLTLSGFGSRPPTK